MLHLATYFAAETPRASTATTVAANVWSHRLTLLLVLLQLKADATDEQINDLDSALKKLPSLIPEIKAYHVNHRPMVCAPVGLTPLHRWGSKWIRWMTVQHSCSSACRAV